MITLTFSCGGCDREEQGKTFVRSTFTSITGKSYGLGSHSRSTYEELTPEGWIAFDPYTQSTYCPDCWASIENDDFDDTQESSSEATKQEES